MNNLEKIRLDKWLWAARFYKTRTLSKEAIEGGKVHVNGQRCKGSKEVKVGDILCLRLGWDKKTINIKALSNERRQAQIAEALYDETLESIQIREASVAQRKTMRGTMTPKPTYRPNKKQRRDILKQKHYASES